MKTNIGILLSVLALLSLFACEDYVSNIEPYNDRLVSEALNTETSVPALIVGIDNQVAWTVDDLFMGADGLSDQLIFDTRNPMSTYPGYQMLDAGDPLDYRDENAQPFDNSHELRVLADTLLYRVLNNIALTRATLKDSALFCGYFNSAYAHYLIATYYGRGPTEGGSPINLGRFVPSARLYQTALDRWNESLKYTTNAYRIRLVNSLMARLYLFIGNHTNAAACAAKGLVSPDAPWLAKYDLVNDNEYRGGAGELRDQLMVDPRFNAYVAADSTEAARIKIKKKTGTGGWVFYSEIKYVQTGTTVTPIELMDWQENNLMRAELAVRGLSSDNALTLINQVRTSQGVSALPTGTVITLSDPKTSTKYSIFEERDKALFIRGLRLPDQRRFNKWHLAPGTWQYMPISLAEKQRNPYWGTE
jgi:hypothetical protein